MNHPPFEPLEPSTAGRVAGWVAIAGGVALLGFGLVTRAWEPMIAGILIILLAYLSRYWVPGMLWNWLVKNWPPRR